MLLVAQTETAWDLGLAIPAIRSLRTWVNGGDWSGWDYALASGAVQTVLVGAAIFALLARAGRHRSLEAWIALAVGLAFGQMVGLAMLSLPWIGIYDSLQQDWNRAIKWNVCFFFESGWSVVAAILGMSVSWLSRKHLAPIVHWLGRHGGDSTNPAR